MAGTTPQEAPVCGEPTAELEQWLTELAPITDPDDVEVDETARLWWTWGDGTRVLIAAGAAEGDDDEEEDEDEDEELEELAELTVRQLNELTGLSEDDRAALAELAEAEEDEGALTAEEAAELRGRLKKANQRARKLRLALKSGKKPEPDDDDKATAKATRGAVAAVLKAELRSAGASEGLVKRAHTLVDLDGLEVDDDGDVDGLEELVEELRGDFPESFKAGAGDEDRPRRRRRQAPPGGGGRKGDPGEGKGKSVGERLAAGLAGFDDD